MSADSGFLRWTGAALVMAGVLTFAINVGLTPLLPEDATFAESAATQVFLWRQSLSALAAILLLFGSVGVYRAQEQSTGLFGALSFGLAFLGSALLLATEWGQVFLVRDLALRAPEALATLDQGTELGLDDLGALIALACFSLGWIALAAATLRAGVLSRRGPILVIVGMFAVPMLGGPLGLWGVIAGNAILAAGWIVLGLQVRTGRTQLAG